MHPSSLKSAHTLRWIELLDENVSQILQFEGGIDALRGDPRGSVFRSKPCWRPGQEPTVSERAKEQSTGFSTVHRSQLNRDRACRSRWS